MTDDAKDAERLLIHCLSAGLTAPKAIDRTLYELGYPPRVIAKLRPNISRPGKKGQHSIHESLAQSAMHLGLEGDEFYRQPGGDDE